MSFVGVEQLAAGFLDATVERVVVGYAVPGRAGFVIAQFGWDEGARKINATPGVGVTVAEPAQGLEGGVAGVGVAVDKTVDSFEREWPGRDTVVDEQDKQITPGGIETEIFRLARGSGCSFIKNGGFLY